MASIDSARRGENVICEVLVNHQRQCRNRRHTGFPIPGRDGYVLLLCRKHEDAFQNNRLANLRERGLDAISYRGPRVTADDFAAWVPS